MYLWPPRPEKKIMPDLLPMFQARGWGADIKKNGTCTELSFDPATGLLEPWTRHKEQHILWRPDMASPCLRRLRELKGGLYVLVGELLHSKVKGIRDTLFLFDVLVSDGQDLVGKTLAERRAILHSLWSETPGTQYNVVDDRLWTANLLTGNLRDLFNNLKAPEDEGLVLKDPNSKLDPCYHQVNNQGWQVKCRLPKTMYAC